MENNKDRIGDSLDKIYSIANKIHKSSEIIEKSETQKILTMNEIHKELIVIGHEFSKQISSMERELEFLKSKVYELNYRIRNINEK